MLEVKFDTLGFTQAIRINRVTHSAQIMGLREAAKEIGISAPTLSRVEGGKIADLMTYAKICVWLKCPLDNYFRLSNTPYQWCH